MAGESTNPPSGPGSNPGGVPINDQGAAKPNPAPPPPSSLPPQPTGADKVAEAMSKMGKETEEAMKSLEEFQKKQEEVNKIIQQQAHALEKTRQLDAAYQDAILRRREAEAEATDQAKALGKDYAKYRNQDGSWIKGTEPIRRLYMTQINEIVKSRSQAREAEAKARDAVQANAKAMRAEARSREEAAKTLFMMEDLRDDITAVDEAFKSDLDPTIKELQKSLATATKNVSDYSRTMSDGLEKTLKEVAAKASRAEMEQKAEYARREFEVKMELLKEDREARRRAIQVERDDRIKANDEMLIKAMEGGGIEGASDIKGFLDDFIKLEEERIKKLNPEASDRYIANQLKKNFADGKAQAFIMDKLAEERNKEIIDIEKKAIEKIIEERKVSRTVAKEILERQKIDKSSDIHKELKVINQKSERQIKQLSELNENQLGALSRMDTERADNLEAMAEQSRKDPMTALEALGDRFSSSIEALKDSFGSIFKKDDGWLKTIAIVLTIVIGATLGYIWAKIKLIVGLLGYIPGIGKYITQGFASFTKGMSSAGGFISKMLNPLKTLFGVLGKIFPSFAGFGGRLAGIFMKSFKFLGPVGLVITTLYDAISGAVKGFKEMGIKGIIMGAVAGIISGLTFGLVDFKTIFDVLKKYFGMFFDAINKLVMAFMWVYQPLIDAFKKIMSIFQGEGSIISKIFKSLWEIIKAAATTMFRYVLNMFVRIPLIILKAVTGLVVGIVTMLWDLLNWTIEKLAEGIIWVWDWFTSGQFLGDLANFGTWLWDEITSFFGGIIDSIADALGEIPFIGDAIKGFLGGGSDAGEDVKTTIEKASDTTEKLVNETKSTKEVMLSLPEETAAHPLATMEVKPLPLAGTDQMVVVPMSTASAAQVSQASAQASSAQFAAQQSGGQSTAINAPTTNVVSSGGGESAVLMPSLSRNNDPTFRALLFLEQPAL
jgi:hypothetical protein